MSTTCNESLTCEEKADLLDLVESRERAGVEMGVLAIQARFEPDRWVAVARTLAENYHSTEDGVSLRQRCQVTDFMGPRPSDYKPFCFLNENQHICWLNTILHVNPPPLPLPLPHPPLYSTITFTFTPPHPPPHPPLPHRLSCTGTSQDDHLCRSTDIYRNAGGYYVSSFLFIIHHASF